LTQSGDVDLACVRGKSNHAFSHDNLFHSVLGLMDVRTSAYHPSSDIFDGCRGTIARSLAQVNIDKKR
jgi:lipid A ethanolaminephosphotransferase